MVLWVLAEACGTHGKETPKKELKELETPQGGDHRMGHLCLGQS